MRRKHNKKYKLKKTFNNWKIDKFKFMIISILIMMILTPNIKINAEESYKHNESIEMLINESEELSTKAIDTISVPITIRDYQADGFFFEPASFAWDEKNWGLWKNGWLSVDDKLDSETKKPKFTDFEQINRVALKLLEEIKWGNPKTYNTVLEQMPNAQKTKDRLYNATKNIKKDINYDNENDRKEAYEDAKNWYNEIKNKPYKDVVNEINTVYRHAYYYMNKFFDDLTLTDNNGNNLNLIQNSTVNNNIKITGKTLELKNVEEGLYTYDSGQNQYFPINGEGFGNEIGSYTNDEGKKVNFSDKNFHFSLEGKTDFYVDEDIKEELKFNFRGDDDVWIYIDDDLVIDLGGIHGALEGSFTIKKDENGKLYINSQTEKGTKKIEISKGWHTFYFFYMERHTEESNLKISTNIEFKDRSTIEKIQYIKENDQNRDLNDNDFVYSGEKVYYRFKFTNNLNWTLKNLEIIDETLGIKIDKDGLYKWNGSYYNWINKDKIIVKRGNEIYTDWKAHELLKELNEGETIEILCEEYLFAIASDDHINNGLKNSFNLSAKYGNSNQYEYSNSASCKLKVKKITYNINFCKEIYEISRGNNKIYSINDSHIPALMPGDIVKFKIYIKNESVDSDNQFVKINNLNLIDKLTINDSYTREEWNFTNGDNQIFNVNDFSIEANSYIDVYTTWEVSLEEVNMFNIHKNIKEVKNEAIIAHPILGEMKSEVEMKLQPAIIRVKKTIENFNNYNSEVLITLSGEDGSKYTIKSKPGEEYILENLKYQEYTISEIVPMNYELSSIKIDEKSIKNDEQNNGTFNLNIENYNKLITITNKKVNDNYFFDYVNIENKFNISN